MPSEIPSSNTFVSSSKNEAEYVKQFWGSLPQKVAHGRVAVDITGFIRPYLIFLLRWFVEIGLTSFDAFYSEPIRYVKGEQTKFSDEAVTEVRQIVGFEGNHIPDTSKDVLIIGAGYDHKLIAEVAEHKDQARKVQIFGLPSLRADMYQENVLNAHKAEEAVGSHMSDEMSSFFAPANDPFVTAAVLQDIVRGLTARRHLTNLYISPLATKPQVLGFALFFLSECRAKPVSLIFPFCDTYTRETSLGIARIWKYTVELPKCS